MDQALPIASRPRIWGYILASLLVAACLYLALSVVFLRQAEDTRPGRAAFLASTIDGALSRLDHLPFLVASDARVVAALQGGSSSAVNAHLSEVAMRARAEVVYLMDTEGLTIAASNHDTPDSFVGQHYTFRPYFRDALRGQTGRFFAVGVTTGRPGYFVSHPVRTATDKIIGVAVVKIGVSDLTAGWTDSGDQVLVTNSDGVVLAASTPQHLFQTLEPLSDQQRATLALDRQFDDAPLSPLNWSTGSLGRATLDNVDYLWSTSPVGREGWTVHLLSSVSDLRLRALLYLAVAAAGIFAILIAAGAIRSARLNRALAASIADRNRLGEEIEERKLAEQKLNEAQAELQQSSRLAALGQLSASITHELGQPISAMRNYLAAEEIAAGAQPLSLNAELSGLVGRMQRITDQLRFFATPAKSPMARVDLSDVARDAMSLVAHDIDKEGVVTDLSLPKETAIASGVQHRLEQVVVNLLRNAIQTSRGQEERRLSLKLHANDNKAILVVTDNGPGIGNSDITTLSEPFMTTKSSGDGMGLGLAISSQIAKDHNGTITARNRPEGGAEFSLILPAIEGQD